MRCVLMESTAHRATAGPPPPPGHCVPGDGCWNCGLAICGAPACATCGWVRPGGEDAATIAKRLEQERADLLREARRQADAQQALVAELQAYQERQRQAASHRDQPQPFPLLGCNPPEAAAQQAVPPCSAVRPAARDSSGSRRSRSGSSGSSGSSLRTHSSLSSGPRRRLRQRRRAQLEQAAQGTGDIRAFLRSAAPSAQPPAAAPTPGPQASAGRTAASSEPTAEAAGGPAPSPEP